jgi:hypothetical protein
MLFAFELVAGKVPIVGGIPYGSLAIFFSVTRALNCEPRPCKHAIGGSIATVQWSDGCVKLRRVLEEVITLLDVR